MTATPTTGTPGSDTAQLRRLAPPTPLPANPDQYLDSLQVVFFSALDGFEGTPTLRPDSAERAEWLRRLRQEADSLVALRQSMTAAERTNAAVWLADDAGVRRE